MYKKLVAIVISATLVSGLSASRTDNFQPYTLVINNNSGGLLDIKKTKGLAGVTSRTDLEDGESKAAMVKRRGSVIVAVAGPENSKKSYTVEMYNKMAGAHRPTVTFTETGVVTTGFSTQNKVYRVALHNQSGGFARILQANDATGQGMQIPPMKSFVITVKPNAALVVEMGPEKRKLVYKINFADQTGRNPNITLGKRGFTTNGVRAHDLQIQSRRITAISARPNLAARVTRRNLDEVNNVRNSRNRKRTTEMSFSYDNSQVPATKNSRRTR